MFPKLIYDYYIIFSRERNKMHAKKTREKKKQFFEESEKMLNAMVNEHNLLREYLISVKVMSRDEDTKAKQRDIEAEKELESYKVCILISFFLLGIS